MHKIINFDLYDIAPPSASKHTVNIVEKKGHRVVKEDVTLEELYEEHASPGKFVHLVDAVDKTLANNIEKMREDNTSVRRRYAIVDARIDEKIKARQKKLGEVSGTIKEAHLTLSSPPVYTRIVFDRVYNFIETGSPVEMCIRVFSSSKDRKYEVAGSGLDTQKWLHEHYPHLRPDFILKSMPEGTEFLIKPVTNGNVVQFVLGKRPAWMKGDLTERAFKVKGVVKQTLPENISAQNYLTKQEKNQARIVQAELGKTSNKPFDTSPFKEKQHKTLHVGTTDINFELGTDGFLSRSAAERQQKIRQARGRKQEQKAGRRVHRWESRGNSTSPNLVPDSKKLDLGDQQHPEFSSLDLGKRD